MEETQKISFFKRFLISLKDFEKYNLFIEEKLGKSIKYILQLCLIIVIFVTIAFASKYIILINDVIKYINNDLPNFKYENGILDFNIDEPLIIYNSDTSKKESYKIIIDTKEISEEQLNQYKEQLRLFNYGILFLKDKVIISSSLASRTLEQTYYDIQANYGIVNSFSKEDMLNYINNNKKNIYLIYVEFFAVVYLYLFGNYFITILLDAILLSILGYITSRIVKEKIKFKGVYAMALHALTLPTILNAMYLIINTCTGFYIKYFNTMYTAISYIYIIAAILSIRQKAIKQQIMVGIDSDVHIEPKKEEKTESDDVEADVHDDQDENDDKLKSDDVGVDDHGEPETN